MQAPKSVTDKHAGIQKHDKLKKPSKKSSHHDIVEDHHDIGVDAGHHAIAEEHHIAEHEHHEDVDPYTYYAEELDGRHHGTHHSTHHSQQHPIDYHTYAEM